MRILDSIKSPADLGGLRPSQLSALAQEIREEIIATVSKTGGHLAPNLGVVELTIALHLSFDSPRDKIVWDVGHQCYTHKILTGRRDRFPTLRQMGGLSGFPRCEESPHDIFNTGHGSTSISVALGMAKARDLAGGREAVVAVIGDGALTGGMAFEALNQAGHLKTNLVVILNDNEMSISPSVGALASYLNRLRLDPYYLRAKENFEAMMQRLPRGAAVLEVVERLKTGIKQLLVPGMLFEELGFRYIGPVDGHNIPQMVETFTNSKGLRGPVLIHVITKKGKGYGPAEQDASKFHGLAPVQAAPADSTFTFAFAQALLELAERDDRIVAITAAMGEGTGLEAFSQRFPQRFFDVGMAEEHAITFAAGLAKAGLRPLVAIYSTFLQRAYDQILHDVCLQNLPVLLAVDRAGIVGEDGPTHQGQFDLSYLRHMPNLTLMAPGDLEELGGMLGLGLALPGPAALRYPRASGPRRLAPHPQPLSLGRALVLKEGQEVGLLAVGSMVEPALEAARLLGERGIEAAVVNARFVKPLDSATILEVAQRTGRLVTVEENALAGGFGSAVLELLAEAEVREVRVSRLGLPDGFVEHGPRACLLERLGLSAEGIAEAAQALLKLDREGARMP